LLDGKSARGREYRGVVTKRIRRSFAVLALAAGLALPAAVLQAQTTAPVLLHIATPGGDGNAMAWYAQDTGIFRKYGLDAQIEAIRRGSGAAIAAAVTGGSADIGEGDIISVAAAREHGIVLTMLAPSFLYRGTEPVAALIVAKTSTFKVAKDLEGSVIAVPSLEGPAKLATQKWLQSHGADIATIKFVELAPANMAASVAQGTVAAASLNEPYLAPALDRDRELGYPYDAFGKTVQVSAWFARDDWVKAHADVAQRFTRAMRETAAWANDPKNRPQSAAILQKYDNFPSDQIARMRRAGYGERFDPAVMQPLLDAAFAQKSLPNPIEAKDLIASSAAVK
jgi:ABC-type nitrate/sulfonate/bicarbonate transport system substrate-binding protein